MTNFAQKRPASKIAAVAISAGPIIREFCPFFGIFLRFDRCTSDNTSSSFGAGIADQAATFTET